MNDFYRLIETFNAGRIPEMLKVKYKLMRGNSFSFFRDSNHLTAYAQIRSSGWKVTSLGDELSAFGEKR